MECVDQVIALEASGSLPGGERATEDARSPPRGGGGGGGGRGEGGGGGGGGHGGRGGRQVRPAATLRESLLGRIVLSGGSSQLSGLPERLQVWNAHGLAF